MRNMVRSSAYSCKICGNYLPQFDTRMTLRPQQVHWFEAEVPREQTVYALEILANSGSVQLETREHRALPCVRGDLIRRQLSQLDKLIKRHQKDLPPTIEGSEKKFERPEQIAEEALNKVRAWSIELLEIKQQIKRLELERNKLRLFHECLVAIGNDAEGLDAVGHATDLLYKHIFACPQGQINTVKLENGVFERVYRGEHHDFWLIIGMSDREEVLEGAAVLLQCMQVAIPDWLPKDPDEQWRLLEKRLKNLNDQLVTLESRLSQLQSDKGIGACLGSAQLLRWYSNISIDQTPDHSGCQLAGWTTAVNPDELVENLLAAGIKAKLVFVPPRGELKPPVNLESSRWDRDFGVFVKLLGTPGRYEIDPTPLVAVIVPLLFGFMFPDLGHGLVLALAGGLLSRRHKAAIILVPCGLVAAFFGLLFGEVFGIHDLIASPIGSPMDHPLQILIATVLVGVSLIMLGLVFSGIEAWWRGETGRWMLEEAPIITLYLSAALTLVYQPAWIASILSLAWYLVGMVVLSWHEESKHILARIGRLIESSFQLVVATFSFLRVGAFALAHAGFSIVVLELVKQVDTQFLQVVIFVLGHVFIIIVEGAIVMIQTTRLVLFEFFMRFLRFEGRIYTPLESPGIRKEERVS